MSDIYQALQDVNWLAERLKGLIALSEEIETYDTLKTQTEDLQKALDQARSDYTDALAQLEQTKADTAKAISDESASFRALKTKCDGLLADTNTQAAAIRASAEADAEELRKDLTEEESAAKDKQIAADALLTSTNSQITTAQATLKSLQDEIANIKAKF